jgi:hypothetical protein
MSDITQFPSKHFPSGEFDKQFCEWFSGLVDGDGYINIVNKKSPRLTITMGLEDHTLLLYIQSKLGGYVTKPYEERNAYIYRIHNKEGILKVVSCLNGFVRSPNRINQLQGICNHLEIDYKEPIEVLDKSSAWFAGFFDADGTVGYQMIRKRPQMRIRISNKYRSLADNFQHVFGGQIYFDNRLNGYYEWFLAKRDLVLEFLEYAQNQPFKSRKSKRIYLLPEYYTLLDRKVYKEDNPDHNEWLSFKTKWNHETV